MVEIFNDWLWTYVVTALLVGCALWFTVRGGFLQFRMLRDMLAQVFEKKGGEGISAFQAFAVALSSRVGTGNLAGVASAIFVGGPGAVFWMWVMALLGAATAFVEATLAQLYKRKGKDSFYGGPAYYMQYGLGRRWMGVLFAILITLTFGMANQLIQSNTLCDAIADAFFWNKAVVGIVISVLTLTIIYGGIHRIANFAALVVPFMALGFMILSLYVVLVEIDKIPAVMRLIFDSAFGLREFAGGAIGTTIMIGIRRGLFSNEAGEGSAPNAAAIAHTSHPVKQGLLQALGVFSDTIIICSCTAFIILLSGKWNCGKDGILLTAEAMDTLLGPAGRYFITAAIGLFAYSTIIANYFYGENNIRFVTRKEWPVRVFHFVTVGVVMSGALMQLQTAWTMVDVCMGLMTLLNLIAIILLSPKAFALLKDYREQKRQGKDPVFHAHGFSEADGEIECWK